MELPLKQSKKYIPLTHLRFSAFSFLHGLIQPGDKILGGKIIGRDLAPAALSALARMCSQPLPKSGNDPFHGATLRHFLLPWEVVHLLFSHLRLQ